MEFEVEAAVIEHWCHVLYGNLGTLAIAVVPHSTNGRVLEPHSPFISSSVVVVVENRQLNPCSACCDDK